MATRRSLAFPRQCFEGRTGGFIQHRPEPPHQGCGLLEKIRENIGKCHGARKMQSCGCRVKGSLFESPFVMIDYQCGCTKVFQFFSLRGGLEVIAEARISNPA
jgi:hypothetical protein